MDTFKNDDYLDDVVLPQWLADMTPEPRPDVTIDYVDGKYTVHNPVQNTTQEFDDLGTAYNSNYDNVMDDEQLGGITFTDNLPEVKENPLRKRMISIASDHPRLNQVLISSTDRKSLKILKCTYKDWLSTYEEYVNNPDDLMTSYEFIDQHPAFWLREKINKESSKPSDRYGWSTSGFAMRLSHQPRRAEDGSVVHTMETGGHVPPKYDELYHDIRLDVCTNSYDSAIIEMASLVHKFFNPDGSDREGVEYDKSDLELLLEERVKDVEKDLSESDK